MAENLKQSPNRPAAIDVIDVADVPKSSSDAQVSAEVAASTILTQAEVADVLGGIDTAESSEGAEDDKGFSEDTREDRRGGGGAAAQPAVAVPVARPLPPPAQMQKEIAAAIRAEIRAEEKKVLKVYFGLEKMSPSALSELLRHIRRLKDLLSQIFESAADALTDLYRKWVLKQG